MWRVDGCVELSSRLIGGCVESAMSASLRRCVERRIIAAGWRQLALLGGV